MKRTILSLLLVFTVFTLNAQENHQKKIDYQYSRTPDVYVAYTLSVDTLTNSVVVDFVINKRLKKINKLLLIGENREIELKYVGNSISPSVDDKELNIVSLVVSFPVLNEKEPCSNTLRFFTSNKRFFDLPVDLYLLKSHLK